jgi:ABC-2 type transport system ATP-binding protein
MASVISLERLTVIKEKDRILTDLSAKVEAGTITGLLGPSGSGKTTLMRTIVGLQRPTSGKAIIFNERAGSKVLRKQIGYMAQSSSTYADLTILENMRYFAAMVGASRVQVDEILHEVELTPYIHRLVKGLSGGQRSRVSLGIALLGRPHLLILDEPTVGLDPVLREQLWNKFHELTKSGTTLLVSSHVMDEAMRCDTLLLMREGKIIANDTAGNIMNTTGTQSIEQAFLKLVKDKA